MGTKKLNAKEEKYLTLMLSGEYTQRPAFREAFPHTSKWKDKTIDEHASRLYNSDKFQTRWKEELDKINKPVRMSKTEALMILKKVVVAWISDL